MERGEGWEDRGSGGRDVSGPGLVRDGEISEDVPRLEGRR